MFPLQFMGMLGRFDLECTVSSGGRSSQAGALRLAIAQALLGFLSNGEIENMRQGEFLVLYSCFSSFKPADDFNPLVSYSILV